MWWKLNPITKSTWQDFFFAKMQGTSSGKKFLNCSGNETGRGIMKFQWNCYWDFDILMTQPLPRMHLHMPCVRIQFKSAIMLVVILKDEQLYCNNSSFITLSVYSYTRGQDIRRKLSFVYFKPFLNVKTQRKKRREEKDVLFHKALTTWFCWLFSLVEQLFSDWPCILCEIWGSLMFKCLEKLLYLLLNSRVFRLHILPLFGRIHHQLIQLKDRH